MYQSSKLSQFTPVDGKEVRMLFDFYIEDSLKSKTRAGRTTSDAASKASYDVHDQMCIKTLSLNDLFHPPKLKMA